MDDDIHMYKNIVHKIDFDSEAVTCFDDKQEYGSSRYEELKPQSLRCTTGNMRTAVSDAEVKGPSDGQLQKDELKQIKKWLCVLSLLVAILFLTTLASLSLAAYAVYSAGSFASRSQIQSTGVDKSTESLNDRLETYSNVTSEEIHQLQNLITTMDTRINDTNMQVDTLVSRLNVINIMIDSRINITGRDVANLRSTVNTRLNTINSEVVSQMTFINALKLKFNTTNATVISLQSQLSAFLANISSLQIALRSQPRKY